MVSKFMIFWVFYLLNVALTGATTLRFSTLLAKINVRGLQFCVALVITLDFYWEALVSYLSFSLILIGTSLVITHPTLPELLQRAYTSLPWFFFLVSEEVALPVIANGRGAISSEENKSKDFFNIQIFLLHYTVRKLAWLLRSMERLPKTFFSDHKVFLRRYKVFFK